MEGKMANVYFFNQECILDTDKKKKMFPISTILAVLMLTN